MDQDTCDLDMLVSLIEEEEEDDTKGADSSVTTQTQLKEIDLFEPKECQQQDDDNNKTESVKQLFGSDVDSDEESNANELNDFGKFVKKRMAHAPSYDVPVREKKSWTDVKKSKQQVLDKSFERTTTTTKKKNELVERDVYSNLRIKNPLVSSTAMKERMTGRKMVRMSHMHRHIRHDEIEGDWVTIGVIINKINSKMSSKGKVYSIWKLSDLEDCSKIVSLFLFGNSHQNLWKNQIGTIIGILNPRIMPKRNSQYTAENEITLSVDKAETVMVIGQAKDFGYCNGRRKDGSNCTNFVNLSSCPYCEYHVQAAYRKVSRRRMDLQASYSAPEPTAIRQKILKNQQIMYGGRLYSSSSREEKSKTKKKNNNQFSLDNFKIQLQAKGIKQEAEQSVLNESTDNVLQSDSVKELLSVPNAGSKNLLKSLDRTSGIKAQGLITSITAAELLKQHQQAMKGKLQSPSIAKLRAIAAIKQSGPITQKNPNAVKPSKDEIRKSVSKRLQVETSPKEQDGPEPSAKRSKLMDVDVNSSEFQALLKRKSAYSDLLTLEEYEKQEKYFNTLEQKEQIETKMCSIKEIMCDVVTCKQCKYTALTASDLCKAGQHFLVRHKAMKRFFRCKNCNQRAVSFTRIPTKPCRQCGQLDYERTAMWKERNGPRMENEVLSLRGNEMKYLGGGEKLYINL